MSFRSSNPATAVTTAIGWFGLAIFAFLAIWGLPKESLSWWVKIAAGLGGALAFLSFGIDAMANELTVHRWWLSQILFTTVTIVLIVAAILNANVLGLGRPLMLVVAVVYLVAAVCCAAASRELF